MKPICTECRGDAIRCLASCQYDPISQCWIASATEFPDDYFCETCDGECDITWVDEVDA